MCCFVGDPTGAEKHAFHNLVWFDHLLRMFGPLFPFMVLATRFKLASLAPDILAFDRQPWLEQLIVYIGITATRTGIYYIHRIGKLINGWCLHALRPERVSAQCTQVPHSCMSWFTNCILRYCLWLLVYPLCPEASITRHGSRRYSYCKQLLLVESGCALFAGIFYYLARAGAVSALPAHLMSDHVFLGSSLVALLAAEAVLLARDIRSVSCSLPLSPG